MFVVQKLGILAASWSRVKNFDQCDVYGRLCAYITKFYAYGRPAICIDTLMLCIWPAYPNRNFNPTPAVYKLQFTAVLCGCRAYPLVLLFYCPRI